MEKVTVNFLHTIDQINELVASNCTYCKHSKACATYTELQALDFKPSSHKSFKHEAQITDESLIKVSRLEPKKPYVLPWHFNCFEHKMSINQLGKFVK